MTGNLTAGIKREKNGVLQEKKKNKWKWRKKIAEAFSKQIMTFLREAKWLLITRLLKRASKTHFSPNNLSKKNWCYFGVLLLLPEVKLGGLRELAVVLVLLVHKPLQRAFFLKLFLKGFYKQNSNKKYWQYFKLPKQLGRASNKFSWK